MLFITHRGSYQCFCHFDFLSMVTSSNKWESFQSNKYGIKITILFFSQTKIGLIYGVLARENLSVKSGAVF